MKITLAIPAAAFTLLALFVSPALSQPHLPVEDACQHSHSVVSGTEKWTGQITRISESNGDITKFKFEGTDSDGNAINEWVAAGSLTEEEEGVLRRLKDSQATDVIIEVEDNGPGDPDPRKRYTGNIEYSSRPLLS